MEILAIIYLVAFGVPMTATDTPAKSDEIFCGRATTEVTALIFVSTLCGSDMI